MATASTPTGADAGAWPAYLALHRAGELAARAETAAWRLRRCTLCPRECRVDRLMGELGECRTGALARVESYGPHFGEEAPLVGYGGSGTIFFAGCNLACIHCQNHDISQPVSDRQLPIACRGHSAGRGPSVGAAAVEAWGAGLSHAVPAVTFPPESSPAGLQVSSPALSQATGSALSPATGSAGSHAAGEPLGDVIPSTESLGDAAPPAGRQSVSSGARLYIGEPAPAPRPRWEQPPERIAHMMLELQEAGCENINLVSPSHVVPQILAALVLAVEQGLHLPLVYNSGGYDSVSTLRLLDGVVDIYMPDMKYADASVGQRLSGVPDYPERNHAAVLEMHRQVGELMLDERGAGRRGLLVRHLVLPQGLAGTVDVVDFIATELSLDTYVNIMGQYHPAHEARSCPEISAPIMPSEHEFALQMALTAGLRRLDGLDA